MAFGMQILTSDGYQNILDIRTARVYGSYAQTNHTGSLYLPGYTQVNNSGHITVQVNDNKSIPSYYWTESTKTLTWAPPGGGIYGITWAPYVSTNFVFVALSFS